MRRRAFLALIASVGVAGCFTSDDDRAESMVEDVGEDMPVESWTLDDGTLSVRYETSGSISTDVERLALSYADVVDDGLDADLRATSTGASNSFVLEIDRELAKSYLDGEISEEEYLERARSGT